VLGKRQRKPRVRLGEELSDPCENLKKRVKKESVLARRREQTTKTTEAKTKQAQKQIQPKPKVKQSKQSQFKNPEQLEVDSNKISEKQVEHDEPKQE